MARRNIYGRPLDNRWEFVEKRDSFGRPVLVALPKLGSRFGKLVTVRVTMRSQSQRDEVIELLCDCGRPRTVEKRVILRERATECLSCSKHERSIRHDAECTIGDRDLRYMWSHRYSGIVSRCYNPACRAFKNYGGRGIRMHDEWRRDREAFYKYAKTLPGWDDLSLDLDRINNDGHYEPGNLRCVDRSTNTRNTRGSVYLTYRGKRHHLKDFHKRYTPNWNSINTIAYHIGRGRSVAWIVARHRKTRGSVRSDGLRTA